MRASTVILAAMAVGCSPAEKAAAPQDAKLTPLIQTGQYAGCREEVRTGLSPDSFDYGVVSSAAAAKELASAHFKAMFSHTDVPVGQVLQRPLTAELRNGVWHVATTVPKDALGVQLFAQICQSNGRVLLLNGGQ